MAHAAVVSLMHTVEQIHHGDGVSDPDENQLLVPLIEKLSSLMNFLEESSQSSREDVKSLERKIRHAAYLAEDVFESHISDHLLSEHQNLSAIMLSAEKYHLDLQKIMTEINTIVKEVMEVEDVKGEQNLQPRNFLPSRPAPSGQTHMVGFAQDLMQIKDRLCDDQQSKLQFVPIIGMGGMGPEWIPTEGEFLKLKFLLIWETDLKQWRAHSTHFPRLEHFILRKCSKLVEIPFNIGEIQTLEIIEIDNSSPSAVKSAMGILEEQRDRGNEVLEVLFHQTKERLYPLKYGIQQDESGHFQRRETKLDRLRKESDDPSGSNTRSKDLKMVIKIDVHDEKEKEKAMKLVSSLSGIHSVATDLEKKLTVVGDFDPVKVVGKLKKLWQTEIVAVGPAK